jgi:heme oxygenase
MRRTLLLMADLTALGGHRDAPPVPALVGLLDHFRKWAADSPWALAGPLYVVEGSRMGSMFLARSLSKALGVPTDPGSGLDYHAAGSATRPRDWNQFRATLSGLALSESQQADVIDAAVTTMNHMIAMYGGAFSQTQTGRHS